MPNTMHKLNVKLLPIQVLATYSERLSQCEVGEEDIGLQDVANLASDSLIHMVTVKRYGSRSELCVAS